MNEALLNKIRESGWRVEELAGVTRIPEITIYNILAGRQEVGLADLRIFARVLGCDVKELKSGA